MPSGFRRAIFSRMVVPEPPPPSLSNLPTTTIFPSGCTAMPRTTLFAPGLKASTLVCAWATALVPSPIQSAAKNGLAKRVYKLMIQLVGGDGVASKEQRHSRGTIQGRGATSCAGYVVA